jgi:hypothetical protein
MSSRPPVRVLTPPHGGRLDAWGRGPWCWAGLVVWSAIDPDPAADGSLGRDPVGEQLLAAWIPAVNLVPHPGGDYSQVRRIVLPGDPNEWPAPTDQPSAPWPRTGRFLGLHVAGEIPEISLVSRQTPQSGYSPQ